MFSLNCQLTPTEKRALHNHLPHLPFSADIFHSSLNKYLLELTIYTVPMTA